MLSEEDADAVVVAAVAVVDDVVVNVALPRSTTLQTILGTNPIKSEVILSTAVMYAARMIVGATVVKVVVTCCFLVQPHVVAVAFFLASQRH